MPTGNACASRGSETVDDVSVRGPVTLSVPGLQHTASVYVHDGHDEIIAPALLRDACWERLESELLLACLDAGHGVLDVGANIGYFTVLSALAVGTQGRVWAFEPEPGNAQLLARNIALNRLANVCQVPAALGSTTGQSRLFLSPTNMGDHSLAGAGNRESITVNVLRGDDCVPVDAVIHLIKIDVQGAEPAVLSGLEETIARNLGHLRLMLEFCPGAMDKLEAGSAEYLLECLTRWDKPVYAIDHWRNALVETSVAYLHDWLCACRHEDDAEGFFNLLVGEPPEGIQRFAICAC